MTQPTLDIDELLTKMGEAYRALLPQRTAEEDEAHWQEYNARFYAKVHADLDERNVVICCLCHTERPRTSPDEPYYYPADECPREVRVWHYHRFWGDQEADRESKRQHALAVARRRGRIPAHSG